MSGSAFHTKTIQYNKFCSLNHRSWEVSRKNDHPLKTSLTIIRLLYLISNYSIGVSVGVNSEDGCSNYHAHKGTQRGETRYKINIKVVII